MQCSQCQAENRKERQFCAECGAALNLASPSCGFSNEPGEKFCGGCGIQIPEAGSAPKSKFSSPGRYTPKHLVEKILQSKTVLEGERKQVTALFCDIANSTVLANRLGPEEMHGLLNEFFELDLVEVHRYEGTINQFLGDGFMALFGAPRAHEDHGRRAVLAALDIRKELQALVERTGQSTQVRMGLNTGLVVIGAIGDNLRMDYTAVGDTTNLAARLQQLAEQGQIVVSESTRLTVEGYYNSNFLGEFSIKGIREPVRAWEILSGRGTRTRLEIEAESGLTPFVGRERELVLLQECFEKARSEQGQMVFIVGEPGIGVGEKMGEKSVLAGGHFILGEVDALTGRLDAAKNKVERALHISQSAGDLMYESLSLGHLGLFKNWQGDYPEASGLLYEGYKIAKDNNLLAPLFDNLFAYGIALTGNGEYDRAFDIFQEGLAFTAKVGDEVFHLRVMNSLGWLYLECGDLARSFDLNLKAAERARRRADPETAANAELNLSDILLLKGDLSSAQQYLEDVHRLANDANTSEWMKWRYTTHLFSSFGEFWLARGDLNRAQKFADRCLDRATRTNSRKYLVKGWRLKGDIAVARKQRKDAEAAFQKALSIAQFISNPTQLWKTLLAMGMLYFENGEQQKSEESYRTAREVIDRIKSGLQNQGLRSGLENSILIREVYENS